MFNLKLYAMKPIHVTKFNEMQDKLYLEYCERCMKNNIRPEHRDRYFPKIKVKYGYVVMNRCNEIYWRKKKSDFGF